MERIQLSVQFLAQPAVRSEPKEKKEKYPKNELHCSRQELEQAFKQALDMMLQPAVDFLLNEQVRPKTVGHKVDYIHNKLGITDEDCEEAHNKRERHTTPLTWYPGYRLIFYRLFPS
jgi:hypothetical protein